MSITIRDVAQAAGVSTATVSRALRGLPHVDPATRDYILSTIISNYNPEAAVVISTHLIADVENILDDVAFLNRGHLLLQSSADELRAREGKSVDAVFREVFRC